MMSDPSPVSALVTAAEYIKDRYAADSIHTPERPGEFVKSNPRQDLLREAESLVNGDRNNQYGPPTQDFDRSAAILTALGYRKNNGQSIEGHDIAIIIMCVKLSRLMWSPEKRDSWVDLAGYSACGFEAMLASRDVSGD